MAEPLSISEIYSMKIQRLLQLQISPHSLLPSIKLPIHRSKKVSEMPFNKFMAGIYNSRTW